MAMTLMIMVSCVAASDMIITTVRWLIPTIVNSVNSEAKASVHVSDEP